ncbi:uncharacterized protein LOC121236661 [Juglans microcarpa x Juglans regia]|uniref:uncharacterized protein LOC121236661 n=1 Tax=Juglans microcarpa x Juglans regia TaxID=2249226 RepID=UPI001B7F3181|nr:uncharacterized protein LOC121236661 [Juglans microcarpa x Juglans regia]
MSSESAKSSQASLAEGEKQKQLDRGLREMVSAITRRAADLHTSDSIHHHLQQQDDNDQDDHHGVRIVTLAGTNTGATLRSEMDEKANPPHDGLSLGEPETLSTYVNSNFQAINNSIMMGGSYGTNDPGVHLDISDYFDNKGHSPDKHGKKGKKKDKKKDKKQDKKNLENDHHPVHSD